MTFPSYRIAVMTEDHTRLVSEDVTAKTPDNLRRNLIECYRGMTMVVSESRTDRQGIGYNAPVGMLTVSLDGTDATWKSPDGHTYRVTASSGRLAGRLS